jgi:hypothetical protein
MGESKLVSFFSWFHFLTYSCNVHQHGRADVVAKDLRFDCGSFDLEMGVCKSASSLWTILDVSFMAVVTSSDTMSLPQVVDRPQVRIDEDNPPHKCSELIYE